MKPRSCAGSALGGLRAASLLVVAVVAVVAAGCGTGTPRSADAGSPAAPADERPSEAHHATSSTRPGPPGRTIKLGVAWQGQANMAKRVSRGLEAALEPYGATFEIEWQRELESMEALAAVAHRFQNEKDGIILLRSSGARFLGELGPSIPSFIGGCNDPVQLGVVSNPQSPEGNITGVTYALSYDDQFRTVLAILPDIQSIHLLYEIGHPGSAVDRAGTRAATKKLGIAYTETGVSAAHEVRAAIVARGPVSAFILGNQALVFDNARDAVDAAGATPVVSFSSKPVQEGVLCGLAADDVKLGILLGESVVEVLLEGTPISEVPIKTDKEPKLHVNIATAQRIGVEIPTSVLGIAQIVDEPTSRYDGTEAMKLRHKIHILSLLVPAVLACTAVGVGTVVINGIVRDLHEDIIEAEVESARRVIQDKISVLERAGVSALPNYIANAQKEVIDAMSAGEFDVRGDLFVLAPDGRIVHHPTLGAEESGHINFPEDMLEGASGFCLFDAGDGEQLCAHASIPEWDWVLGLSIPVSVMYRERNEYIANVSFVTAGMLIVSLFFSYSQGKRFAKRIDVSLETVNSVAGGDFTARIADAGLGDEIAGLQRGINAMAEKIAVHSDHLEDLVNSRTRALTEANEQLEHAKEEAESASRSKSQFLANMSHEIRTPMTAILGYTDVLTEDADVRADPERRMEVVHTIRRNGEHLLAIINDILDISKIEAGKLQVEHIRYSVVRLVADVLALMKVRADAKNLDLEIEFDGPIPELVEGDPTRVKQILVNLIGNAIKFTEVGGVGVVARVIGADANPTLQFDVIDTGVGLTADQIDNLYQAFMQADTSTTRKFGGTGLGLSISKRLAEILGGTITVESEPGKGSTFSVTVATGPLAGVAMIDDPRSLFAGPETSAPTASAAPTALDCRVLLVEDGPDNQRLIAHVLKKAGADVTIRENGKLGAEAAIAARDDGHPFAVILMDMQMPVMDGYTATGYLRNAGYTGTIIGLTAHAMSGDREKCLSAGCDEFATKPIDRAKLTALIARMAGDGGAHRAA